jgi:hypothetical protein
VIFGFTEEQIAHFFLTYGVGAFIVFMVFIILQLARQSKAGKFGTFVIFLSLGVGFVGYLAKIVIQWWMEK